MKQESPGFSHGECQVSKQNQTPELCLEAVKRYGNALQYIPKSKQTLSIAIAALKQDPDSRQYLADRFRTPKVYKAAGYEYKPEDLSHAHRKSVRDRTEYVH